MDMHNFHFYYKSKFLKAAKYYSYQQKYLICKENKDTYLF